MTTGTPYMVKKTRSGPAKKALTVGRAESRQHSTKVSAPVAVTTVERASAGKMSNPRPGCVRVTRREFVGSVTNGSSTVFALDANSTSSPGWDFNPAVSSLFPWLSQLANAYERYRFNRLDFELVSSQATSTAGRIYAAVDYDWDDEVPTTKAQMMGTVNSVEAPAWSNLKIRCDPKQLMRDMPYKYVNTAGRVVYSEPRTAYAGFLIIGIHTPVASCSWDLWVDYDVELEVPIMETLGATLTCPTGVPDTTYVTTLSPWYSASQSSAQALTPTWTANRFVGNLIREVIAGTADVPVLAPPPGFTVDGNGKAWGHALDVAKLGYRHWLSLEGFMEFTGVTPKTLIDTALARMSAAVYDAAGQYLGMLATSGVPTTGLTVVDNGVKASPAELNTASKPARPILTFNMESFKAVYPVARFLVPMMVAATSAALGNGKVGIDYRIF